MKRTILALLLLICLLPGLCLAEEAGSAWQNILLLGGDSRDVEDYERTDTMIILSVNHDERLIKLTSIMRDTWVTFPGTNTSGKINAANVYGGPELVMETVNRHFGTAIDKYVLINMADMVAVIDIVGGIDIEISESELKYINEYAASYMQDFRDHLDFIDLPRLKEAGYVHLNGIQATAYTRNRYSDSDYGRVMRQQKVLLALADTMQNTEVDEMMAMVDDILSHIQTNMENAQLRALAETGMICDLEEIAQFRIPADGTFKSGIHNGVWKIRPYFTQNAALLQEFIYGDGE